MPTSRWTRRKLHGRHLRLAAAVLPLPALLAPAPAHAGATVAIPICSGSGERTVMLPAPGSPSPRRDDQPGCAHFVCPRERGQADPTDDEEE